MYKLLLQILIVLGTIIATFVIPLVFVAITTTDLDADKAVGTAYIMVCICAGIYFGLKWAVQCIK